MSCRLEPYNILRYRNCTRTSYTNYIKPYQGKSGNDSYTKQTPQPLERVMIKQATFTHPENRSLLAQKVEFVSREHPSFDEPIQLNGTRPFIISNREIVVGIHMFFDGQDI